MRLAADAVELHLQQLIEEAGVIGAADKIGPRHLSLLPVGLVELRDQVGEKTEEHSADGCVPKIDARVAVTLPCGDLGSQQDQGTQDGRVYTGLFTHGQGHQQDRDQIEQAEDNIIAGQIIDDPQQHDQQSSQPGPEFRVPFLK